MSGSYDVNNQRLRLWSRGVTCSFSLGCVWRNIDSEVRCEECSSPHCYELSFFIFYQHTIVQIFPVSLTCVCLAGLTSLNWAPGPVSGSPLVVVTTPDWALALNSRHSPRCGGSRHASSGPDILYLPSSHQDGAQMVRRCKCHPDRISGSNFAVISQSCLFLIFIRLLSLLVHKIKELRQHGMTKNE